MIYKVQVQKNFNVYTISVSKKIAKKIGDREAAIATAIDDLFSNDDRDRDRNINLVIGLMPWKSKSMKSFVISILL